MTMMLGYSIKAWWLAVGLPVLGFVCASVVGAVVAAMLVVGCAECRRRRIAGARARDLSALPPKRSAR